jgi:glutaredoxin
VPAPVEPRLVTLYSRPGCHLCEDAEHILRTLLPGAGYHLEVVDIESDDALLRRYMLEIPVVAVDGQEVARAPLSRQLLEDLLA